MHPRREVGERPDGDAQDLEEEDPARDPRSGLAAHLPPLDAHPVTPEAGYLAAEPVPRHEALGEQGSLGYLDALVAGVAYEHVALTGNPVQEILAFVENNNIELIVMASHGRSGFSAAFLGSETQNVLAKATVPVLVCR